MTAVATPDLLTGTEVAARLRISPRTVRRLGESGQLTQIKVSDRTFRYLVSEVDAITGAA